MKEARCSPCYRAGETKEASSRCLDCAEEMCGDCEVVHKNLKLTVRHKMQKLTDTFPGDIEEYLPSIECATHPDQYLQFFCKDHKSACCAKCIISNHRPCKTISDMNELGSDLRTQKVLEENMHRLNELEEKVKFIKTRSNITLSTGA